MSTNTGADRASANPRGLSDCLLPLLLAAALLVVFWPFVTGESAFTFRDASTLVWPQRQFVARAMEEGRLPLWNERFAFGYPAYAEPTAGVWYPLNLLLLWLPLPYGFCARVWLHFPLAMLSMWVLARRLGMGWPGAAAAAGSLSLGGFLVSCTSLPAHLSALTWLPLALASFLKGLPGGAGRRGRPVWISVSAGLVALLSLEADPIWLGLSWGLAAALACAAPERPSGRALARALAQLAVVSALLASVQLLPFARFVLENPRDAQMVSKLDYRLDPSRLNSLLLPMARTSPADPLYLENFSGGERGFIPYILSFYLGLPVLLLALAGLASMPRREAAWIGGLAVAGVLAALGDRLPVLGLLARVPPFSWSRYAEKMMGLTCLLLPLLAGRGLDAWSRGEIVATRLLERISRLALAIAACWCAGKALVALLGSEPGPVLELPIELRPALWVALMLTGVRLAVHLRAAGARGAVPVMAAVMLLDLAGTNRHLTFPGSPGLYTECLPARGLSQGMTPPRVATWVPPGVTLGPVHGVISLERATQSRWRCGFNLSTAACGLDPIYPESSIPRTATLAIYRAIQADPQSMLSLLRAVGCELLLAPVKLGTDSGLEPLPDAGSAPYAYRVRNTAGRAFLATEAYRSELPLEDWLEANRRPMADWRAVTVERTARALPPGGGEPGEARLTSYRGGAIAVEVGANRPALLVVLEAAEPGWRATVDGRPRAIERVSGTFLGVRVAPGERRVELWFEPRDLTWGAGLSLAGAAAAVLLALL